MKRWEGGLGLRGQENGVGKGRGGSRAHLAWQLGGELSGRLLLRVACNVTQEQAVNKVILEGVFWTS